MSVRSQESEFEQLLEYLRQTRGVDFASYKRSTLMRRVAKRMRAVEVSSFVEYMDYLQVHGDEFRRLFDTILINVTSFFRDEEPWEYLRAEIVPRIVAARRDNEPIRVWCAGCAAGHEAYSLAIVFAEALGVDAFLDRVKIYATDIDDEALIEARHGYTPPELESVPEDLREKYFEAQGSRHVFRATLRRALIFGRHDLIRDAPISRLDLLSCRNTLMYFTAEAQGRILTRLHYALNDVGFLFLGRAEMLLTHGSLFSPVDLKQRIFSKVPHSQLRDRRLLLTQVDALGGSTTGSRQAHLREAAADVVPMPQFVLDGDRTLVMANQAARALLGLRIADVGRPLQDLEVSYRPLEIRSPLERVARERRAVVVSNVPYEQDDGGMRYFEVQVTPITDDDGSMLGASVTFVDTTATQRLRLELERTRQEVETAHEELQSSNEELETTNAELQSTVEELETTNEELQSSNEELETMNEELESTNSELQAINADLRQRGEELDRVNLFLQSILTSVRTGVAVLDDDLRVQLWNRRAEDLWGLRDNEVLNRPFLRLDIGLPVGQLVDLTQTALQPEPRLTEQVVEATTRRGKRIRCRVAATPLVDDSNGIRGVVLLMEELALEG